MLGLSKRFPLDLSEVKSAVIAHKIYDGVELLIYKASFIADYCYRDNRAGLAVLMIDFRN